MIDLVCSVCGSNRWSDVQHSVDSRWPVARCPDHHDRTQIWTPLISAGAFAKRTRIRAGGVPIDLFGGLSDEEQRRMAAPLKVRSMWRR